MAECHPVGFQWVMEAKARGATVIHVDPRFTRTSALADLHVPIRAGTDIAFLGGIINYVLTNELDFREYVARLHQRRRPSSARTSATPRTWTALFSGFDRGDRPATTRRPGSTRASRCRRRGRRARPGSDAARHRAGSAPRPGRGETHGSGGAVHRQGEPHRDETLQHPRCVFQVLKRHFARYTPEMVEQICGIRRSCSPQVCRRAGPTTRGRERTTRVRLRRRLDPAHRRRAVHPHRRDPAAAAGQHRPARRRHPGAARARSIQGSTDIPTLFNLLPGYIPMPHAHAARGPRRTSSRPRRRRAAASGATCAPTWSACSRPGGATPRPPRTTSASTTCRG